MLLLAAPVAASQQVECVVRGKPLTLTLYYATGTPKGTFFMASGDVGWVGLAASMSDFLRTQGWNVVGINVRQYLTSFTAKKSHLTVAEPPADYAAIAEYLRRAKFLKDPVIVSGVSEGAAFAVLAGSSPSNHAWVRGVITMGLPAQAELAWKWTDFTTWITKKDAAEPSFAPDEFIGAVSPLPLVMLQSTRDEYVTRADYQMFDARARAPKKLVLIDASNHRFTDKQSELRAEFLKAIEWIASHF